MAFNSSSSSSTSSSSSSGDSVDSEAIIEPDIGLEFDSTDDVRDFYAAYAARVGFRTRIGQLYRNRSDGSVASRRYVCKKEGTQLRSSTGCPAFIRVQSLDSGKWVIDQLDLDHNHEFEVLDDDRVRIRQVSARRSAVAPPSRKVRRKVDDCSFRPFDFEFGEWEFEEPRLGLVFGSAEEGYQFYDSYAEKVGFKIRMGQLFRSKHDGLLNGTVTSRIFVCSREGSDHPSRIGCEAYMQIKIQKDGTWIVNYLRTNHNHDMVPESDEAPSGTRAKKNVVRGNEIGIEIRREWYSVLLDYLRNKQAVDTGFFYSVEVDDNGVCRSVFWADGRSRFSGSQFGDDIVLDTTSIPPFAVIFGVNHHRNPLILGCALLGDKSEQRFTWLFQTWLKAMSGRSPESVTGDQDPRIQQAVARVFPGSHYRFCTPSREDLRSKSLDFIDEYEVCIFRSSTTAEFETAWNALIAKHGLDENARLKPDYANRERWIPLYIRRPFFTADLILVQPPPSSPLDSILDFIPRLEEVFEHLREEESKDDSFSSFSRHSDLPDARYPEFPVEEQFRRLYTPTLFNVFQKELMESCDYSAIKTIEESNTVSIFSVQRCRYGNENEKFMVRLDRSSIEISCSCRMFEFEGMLCRHALRVWNLVGIQELPPRYILHRWTRNAEYGTPRDAESVEGAKELERVMTWSLREAARGFAEGGSTSIERYRVVFRRLHGGSDDEL
ncbi:Protein FAR1-RELATED SEQUENCE 7 [Linum perenne]